MHFRTNYYQAFAFYEKFLYSTYQAAWIRYIPMSIERFKIVARQQIYFSVCDGIKYVEEVNEFRHKFDRCDHLMDLRLTKFF